MRSSRGGRRALLLGAALAAFVWAAAAANARTLHSLVTVTVTGPGHVYAPAPDDPNSGPISCPSLCSNYMKQNSVVTFTATPDGDATFAGWGGACEAFTGSTCTLTISPGDSTTDITAGFNEAPPPPPMETLSIAKAGTGTGYVGGAGGIDCGPTCSGSFVQGSKVALTAVPDDGSDFTGWSGGGCSGTDTCTVTLDANTDVTATFTHLDRTAPHLKTMAASSAPGKKAALRFRVFDDSGKSAELLTIVKGTTTLGRVSVPLASVDYRHVYTAYWRVPTRMKPGQFTFCGVASDAAGNRSTRSCSLLTIK